MFSRVSIYVYTVEEIVDSTSIGSSLTPPHPRTVKFEHVILRT